MKNPLLAPELRELLETNDTENLREFLISVHPAVIADLISALSPAEAWRVLNYTEPILRADIFSHLDEEFELQIVDILGRREAARLIADMPPDDRADLFKRLPEERREYLLPAMAQAEREDIRRLAAYREGTAGSVMTSDYATLSPDLTAFQALERLREVAPDKETIYYAYVVDENRRLLGFVSLKDLILARRNERIPEIMHTDVIHARVTDDQEDVARKIQKYDLIALPVIDDHGALTGIITHDDAMDIISQENTEDIEKLMAISGSHEAGVYLRTPSWIHFKNRAVWVVILALFGLISGLIVQRFEGLLLQFAILAAFMPMLADTGGNTGSQSATLVIRALALREIVPGDIFRILAKELRVALMLGLLLGSIAYGRVLVFGGGSTIPEEFSLGMLGAVIALALALQVVTATLIGAVLPIFAARMKWDPAVVASPALTTIVDITGLLIYFTTIQKLLGI
ncbi:MAG TPA: magnesium transporter [bacterium]|nr:magnesium transporter [bacterium]